ncbi:hypothetical protein B484DRAFT_456341 [Ochromonadaceae sp. CCMP2298]|nr:hypothetical protein B484DRAFT_456341 [Ochromonadaceae sp. CCMP2298]
MLVALTKAPRGTVIFGSLAVSFAIAGLFHGTMLSRGEKPHTMSESWRAANKQYMIFQKMNPISGISKGL